MLITPDRCLVSIGVRRFNLNEPHRPAHRIAARDVALARIAPTDISVQNILPVSVQEVRRVSPYTVRLALRSGEARLLAEITEDARSRLALEPGVEAFALIKSLALVK